jgi:calcineurin-like phosphoesterase family protein
MPDTFFIGCTHFGHDNMYRFTRKNGDKVRPWATAAEGDAVMMENWNRVVGSRDKVYVLGDVAFTNPALAILGQLNGTKVLVKGNHDNLSAGEYLKYFKDIRAYHKLDGEILSHIPLHPESLYRHKTGGWWLNIHAHLHAESVRSMDSVYGEDPDGINPLRPDDDRYFSVCVERIDYTPISLEEIRKRVRDGKPS